MCLYLTKSNYVFDLIQFEMVRVDIKKPQKLSMCRLVGHDLDHSSMSIFSNSQYMYVDHKQLLECLIGLPLSLSTCTFRTNLFGFCDTGTTFTKLLVLISNLNPESCRHRTVYKRKCIDCTADTRYVICDIWFNYQLMRECTCCLFRSWAPGRTVAYVHLRM